jgi:hypothetical protein
MKYTLLFYENGEDFASRTDPERQQQYWGAWAQYLKAMRDAGIVVGGEGLHPPDKATTLTLQRDGEPLVQDGPMADTKEQLGGLFIIDVPDLDTALAWAARCQASPGTIVEVRPCLPPMPRG